MKRNPRASGLVELYVVRSAGPSGEALSEAAFPTKDSAVQYLVALHGLDKDEVTILRKHQELTLQQKVHGATRCAIEATAMTPSEATQALSGEAYLKDAPKLLTPRKLRAPKKGGGKKR